MSLSNKLRAEYIELINQQLDNIQIESLEDFEIAQQALQNIIQPVEGYAPPEKYREKMFLIKDNLQSPEDYVEYERNYSEYQQIIRDRIIAKINELQSLNTTQKQSYIENQQAQRSQTATNQQIMAQRRPPQPDDAAHVQTEAEWLTERQRQLNREPEAGDASEDLQRRPSEMLDDMVWASGFRLFDELNALERRQRRYADIYNDIAWALANFRTDALLNAPGGSVNESGLDLISEEEIETIATVMTQQALLFLDETQYEKVALYVLTPIGIEAILNNTIHFFDFQDLNANQIENLGTNALTHQSCIDAITDGRTTIARLAEMSTDDLRHAVESDDYPRPELR